MASSPPRVLDDLPPLWTSSALGSMISTSLRLRVISVDCYSATPPIIQHWRPKLAYRGCKTSLLFLYDLTAVDSLGKQVIMVISPFHDDNAALLLGATILVTKLIKLQLEDFDKFYLVLADYTMDPSPHTFELRFRGELSLPGYVSLDQPLCCPFAKAVCPWTRLAVLWDIQTIQTYQSLKSLPTNFSSIVNFVNSGSFTLKKLDESFVNMLQGSSKRPLALRILAKSKERIFMNQTNVRRPIGAMTTLLVADNSGHCKVVVWDDAVGHIHKKVVEGDILVLAGKYSVGRYKSQNPSKYNLEPKSRNLHLSPVKVEIKLNVSDMSHICILDSGANLPLPKPEWNFVAVDDLRRNKVLGSRLLDLCGVVLYLGRWERERCYDQEVPTGQYWVRVWITVFDHTSMDAEQEMTSIPIKMFLDSERWEPMSSLVPGCPVVVTNLMFIQTEGVCSHLECTNETQVFVNDEALSSRFSENKVYQEFRETWNDKEEAVKNVVNCEASFGGQAHFGAKVLVTFRTGSFRSPDLADVMRNLVYRASARVLVRGTIGLLVDKTIDRTGKVEEESVNELLDLTGMTSLGDSDPSLDSFERRVEGLSRERLKNAVETACLFVGDKDNFPNVTEKPFATVGIVEGNTVIYCLCTSRKVVAELTRLGSEPASFCLDIVKISKVTWSETAELVVRSVMPIQKDEPANESSVSSEQNGTNENTLDFLEPWNDT